MLPPPLGVEGVCVGAAAYAGVIDEYVYLAVARYRSTHRALPVLRAGDVGTHERGRPAGPHQLGLDLLSLLLQHVGGHDGRALRGEQARLFGTHAVSSSADDRHLAVQAHVVSSNAEP